METLKIVVKFHTWVNVLSYFLQLPIANILYKHSYGVFVDRFLADFIVLLHIFTQGKFIRIHFGPTGKLASADIDICKLNLVTIVFFASCFMSHMNMFLFFLSFRSSGKIQSDISAARWEELPHLLPDHVAEETRTARLVSPAALDILLRTADRTVTWFLKKTLLFQTCCWCPPTRTTTTSALRAWPLWRTWMTDRSWWPLM